ncbi:hypothetical protein U9M48_024876 [Paspalum notatum var. saurae]|uniref:Uncharacterized protein n=1 Tax=Paspalum notatum var. saurae TaxID=547442 RepID=A0AAQ3TP76_PASNO
MLFNPGLEPYSSSDGRTIYHSDRAQSSLSIGEKAEEEAWPPKKRAPGSGGEGQACSNCQVGGLNHESLLVTGYPKDRLTYLQQRSWVLLASVTILQALFLANGPFGWHFSVRSASCYQQNSAAPRLSGVVPSLTIAACNLFSFSYKVSSSFFLQYLCQAACMKQAAQVCWSCLLWSLLNCVATNFKSSALKAKVSTSDNVFTVLVEPGRFEAEVGSRAQVRSSSPQKSPPCRTLELKKPVCPPFVVVLSRVPLIMKSISFTGSPSRMMQLPSVYSIGFRRSHMASKSCSSMFSNIGTCKQQQKTKMPLYFSSEILGKICKKALFVNSSSFLPPILFVAHNSFLEILRKI